MGRFRYIHGAASSVGTSSQGDWHDRSTPAARKCELGTRSKKQKAPPRLAGPRPIGFRRPPAPGAHAAKISNARACPGLRSGEIQWGVGRPAGGRAFFLLRVRSGFFFLLRVRGKFTHSLAARRLRPSTAEKSRVRGVFFSLLRVCELTHSLTRCLPPGAPTQKHPQQKRTRRAPAATKKTRRAPAAKQRNAPGTRSKKTHTHNKK